MRVFVFSDIHSNFFALKAFYDCVKSMPLEDDFFIFLGDIIGYLKPDLRIIELLVQMKRENNTVMLMGNHDAAFFNYIGKSNFKVEMSPALFDTIGRNLSFKDCMLRLFSEISHEKLTTEIFGKKYVFSHAGISDVINHYYYPDRRFLKQYREFFESDVIYVFGHTHRPFNICHESGTFINVGSIGLPRDRDPRLCYLEINSEGHNINRLFYPLDNAYDYNADLKNVVKNRVFFGGNSRFLGEVLCELGEEHDVLKESFDECYCYRRGCYVLYGGFLWQVFRLSTVTGDVYLLRGKEDEQILGSIFDVVRRIKRNETI